MSPRHPFPRDRFAKSPRRIVAWIVAVLAALPAAAQDAQSYSFDTDPTATAFQAPGVPEGSVFAGFGDGENVSLQNGNLLISHPTGPSIPLDGGGSLQLVRSYNAKNVRHDYVHWDPPVDPPEGWGYTESHIYRFQGRSWVGSGWTLHLGRLFWKSRFTTNGYGATDQYFEDPQGTQIGLEDHMRPAHPVLRVEFAQDDGEEWQCPSGEWYCGAECEDPFFIPPGFCTCDCTIATAGGPHYDVKMSDGTVYRMEKIVESVTEGRKGWIGNSDRAGYYTRSITDPYGNVIRVEYEADGTTPGPYPEAIREIWVDPYGAASVERKVIWTDLWEPGDPGYVAAKEGTLRALHAYGPDGAVATWLFDYEILSVGQNTDEAYIVLSDTETIDVPVLTEVQLPGLNPSTETIRYSYVMDDLDVEGPFDTSTLQQVAYPSGGVSWYDFGTFESGTRTDECPRVASPELPHGDRPCADWWYTKYDGGVVGRRVYPEGIGTGKPYSSWTWDREFQIEGGDCISGGTLVNEFRMTRPDGSFVVAAFGGDPCGLDYWTEDDGPPGHEMRRETYSAGGTSPIRTEIMVYDGVDEDQPPGFSRSAPTQVMEQSRVTVYHDDGNRAQSVERFQRDTYNHWRVTRTRGYVVDAAGEEVAESLGYLRGDHVTYTHWTADLEAVEPDFLDGFSYVVREYDGQRTETSFDFDDDGFLIKARKKNEFLAATAGLTDFEAWAPTVTAADADDLVHVREPTTKGNLGRLVYRYGDPGSMSVPVPGDYAALYTWSNGRATNVRLEGMTYDAHDVTVDTAGYVSSGRDPNQIQTDFDYDLLGRLTEITPAGTEVATRILYPDVSSMVVVRDATGATAHSPSNEDQIYSEMKFDGLGRTLETVTATTIGDLAYRVTRYDGMGRVIFVSEPLAAADLTAETTTWTDASGNYSVTVPIKNGKPWGTTTFYGVPDSTASDNPLRATADGLGRVHRVVAADGTVTDTSYAGPHETVTVHGIQTGLAGTTADASTTYRKGWPRAARGRGRLGDGRRGRFLRVRHQRKPDGCRAVRLLRVGRVYCMA